MIKKVMFVLLCSVLLIGNVNATSLRDLKDELAKDIAQKDKLLAREKEIEAEVAKISKEMAKISKEIDDHNKKIEESKQKIKELDAEIIEKQTEIDTLLSFLQVSDGDNVYLEYVFEATSFTDFIYRSAVVEQLTKYNDELIDEMYEMIETNKKLQEELKEAIKKAEKSIDKLEATLKESNLDMNDIDEEKRDVQADIDARKLEISAYEETYKKNGCSEDTDIYVCVGVPYANGFTRPLEKGKVTSNYGMRIHPTKGTYKMHNGLDIGGNSTGTKVYASASGRVNKIVKKSSCGGNMVYIQHNVDGTKYRTVYMHLHEMYVKLNDIVTTSTVIGTVGGGESYDLCTTGPHLHFGVMKGWTGSSYYDPRNYIYFPAKGTKFTSRYY